jgi:hypothetical protein
LIYPEKYKKKSGFLSYLLPKRITLSKGSQSLRTKENQSSNYIGYSRRYEELVALSNEHYSKFEPEYKKLKTLKDEIEIIRKEYKIVNERVKNTKEADKENTNTKVLIQEKINELDKQIKEIKEERRSFKKKYYDEVYYFDEQQELIEYIKQAEKQKAVRHVFI